MGNFKNKVEYFWSIYRMVVCRTMIGEIRKKKTRTLKDCNLESELFKRMVKYQQRIEEIEDKIF